MDYGHEQAEKDLKKLEKRLKKEYTQAAKEVEKKLRDHLKRYEEKDQKMADKVKSGEMSEKDYLQWRAGQMAMGDRWKKLRDELVETYQDTNKVATDMIQDHTHQVYADNFNFGTFEVENGSKVDTSFTLYSKDTVARLVKDNPKLLPPPNNKVSQAIKEGKAKRWNQQKVQSVMTQGILQGESIPKIAKRLSVAVGEMNMHSAIRNARTMTTSAENAGRIDSYKRAQDMGIEVKKQWLATLDGRTRHSHRILDGESVGIDEKFSNGLMFPADPDGAPAEVYNCRCTLIADIAGFSDNIDDLSLRRTGEGFTDYETWKDVAEKVKKPSLKDMIEADASKYSGVQKDALIYYAENGKFPSGISSYQKKKLQGVINQYNSGVQGRDVQFKKVHLSKKPKLPTHDQYKMPTDNRRDADRWVKDEHIVNRYTAKQLRAMDAYMMESDDINGMLRGYSTYFDKSIPRTLSSCMSKYEHDECVFRGVDGKVLGIKSGESVDSIKQRLVGTAYKEDGFMSTSRSLDVAREFSKRGAFDEFEAETPCVLVLDINGVNVAYLNSGLAEILLDKGRTIVYTDVIKEDGVLKIFGRVR